MKILLVSSLSPRGTYGSSRLLRDMVEYLSRRGHQLEVLTYAPAIERGRVKIDDTHGYLLHAVLPRGLPGLSSLAMLKHLIALGIKQRYDLILCGVAYPSAVLVYLTKNVTGRPYAIYSHGEDITMVEGSQAKRALLARALRGARIIMANSTYTRCQAEIFGALRSKVSLVPPWVDPARIEAVAPRTVEALRDRLGLEGKRAILTVAHLDARKGQDTVIRALRSLRESVPNLHYVIAGKGDQSRLRTLATSEGVGDIVTFTDYLSDEELPALYHLCDVYVMVSRWDPAAHYVEGFGIVYLEAAAAGKPCVAGSQGGCPDAVEDGVTGLIVDPTSVGETVEALRALLNNPARAAAMGAAGRDRVYSRFLKDMGLSRLAQVVETAMRKTAVQEQVTS